MIIIPIKWLQIGGIPYFQTNPYQLIFCSKRLERLTPWSCDDGEGTPVRGSDRQESPAEKISIAGMIHLIRISLSYPIISYYIPIISYYNLLFFYWSIGWSSTEFLIMSPCVWRAIGWFLISFLHLKLPLGLGVIEWCRSIPFFHILSFIVFWCFDVFCCQAPDGVFLCSLSWD
jgi:hypothetical protein